MHRSSLHFLIFFRIPVLVPLLTECLQDPLMDKMPCLRALRDTCFVHVLDAPSLALILPVIQRAFDDRSTEARKTAAQIFGNLHSLARQEVRVNLCIFVWLYMYSSLVSPFSTLTFFRSVSLAYEFVSRLCCCNSSIFALELFFA